MNKEHGYCNIKKKILKKEEKSDMNFEHVIAIFVTKKGQGTCFLKSDLSISLASTLCNA